MTREYGRILPDQKPKKWELIVYIHHSIQLNSFDFIYFHKKSHWTLEKSLIHFPMNSFQIPLLSDDDLNVTESTFLCFSGWPQIEWQTFAGLSLFASLLSKLRQMKIPTIYWISREIVHFHVSFLPFTNRVHGQSFRFHCKFTNLWDARKGFHFFTLPLIYYFH